MDLGSVQTRLIQKMRQQVQNGKLTERAFARAVGISQTHIHNVLKGARTLSIDRADGVLKTLNLTILDLFTAVELNLHTAALEKIQAFADVPFLASMLGPGVSWSHAILFRDSNPVPCSIIIPGLKLVLARLTEDHAMNYRIEGHNIAALDLAVRGGLCPDGLYAVDRGTDVVLRRLRPGIGKIYLASDLHANDPGKWEPLATPDGPGAVVRGRVRWFGSEPKARRTNG